MKAGIFYSVLASVLFAALPAYLQFLPDSVNSIEVIGQRIIWTGILMTALLILAGRLRWALAPLLTPRQWPGLLLGAILIGIPWGLFVWAPMNGDTLGIVLGFFLGPLGLVMVGLLFFGERLNAYQVGATALAGLAVASSLWNTGEFSWVAIVLTVCFTCYLTLRRVQPVSTLSAYYLENLLLLPVAAWLCIHYGERLHPFDYNAGLLVQFSGVAVLGTCGMLSWLNATRFLPMAMVGLLGYLEPLLIFLIAISFIGDRIQPGQELTYLFVSLAVLLMGLDSFRILRARPGIAA